jgi:hypothetical protein
LAVYSAVANRSALHPDYYSAKKITVTPLNFVCKCRAPSPFDDTCEAHEHITSQKKSLHDEIFHQKIAQQRNIDKLGLSSLLKTFSSRQTHGRNTFFPHRI